MPKAQDLIRKKLQKALMSFGTCTTASSLMNHVDKDVVKYIASQLLCEQHEDLSDTVQSYLKLRTLPGEQGTMVAFETAYDIHMT